MTIREEIGKLIEKNTYEYYDNDSVIHHWIKEKQLIDDIITKFREALPEEEELTHTEDCPCQICALKRGWNEGIAEMKERLK